MEVSKRKSMGNVAYDAGMFALPWSQLNDYTKAKWENIACILIAVYGKRSAERERK